MCRKILTELNSADTGIASITFEEWPLRNSNPDTFRHKILNLACRSIAIQCERRDLNPHTFRYQILSLARLPIPPLSLRSVSISGIWRGLSTDCNLATQFIECDPSKKAQELQPWAWCAVPIFNFAV